jgi:hypothetical protein
MNEIIYSLDTKKKNMKDFQVVKSLLCDLVLFVLTITITVLSITIRDSGTGINITTVSTKTHSLTTQDAQCCFVNCIYYAPSILMLNVVLLRFLTVNGLVLGVFMLNVVMPEFHVCYNKFLKFFKLIYKEIKNFFLSFADNHFLLKRNKMTM